MTPQIFKFTFLVAAIFFLNNLVHGLPTVSKVGKSPTVGLILAGRNSSAVTQGIMNCTPNNIIGMCQFRTDMSYYTQLYTAHIFGWNCVPLSEQCQGDLGTDMACGSILPDVLTVYTDAEIWVHAIAADYEGNWAQNLRCVNDDNDYGYSSCFYDFPCQYR